MLVAPYNSSRANQALRIASVNFRAVSNFNPTTKGEKLMAEKVRSLTQGQLKKLTSILIDAIPNNLSFDEGQAIIVARDQLVRDVAATFDSYRSTSTKEVIELITYPVTVPYRGASTIEGLIRVGNYNSKNINIDDQSFPQNRTGDEEIEIILVQLGPIFSTKSALVELHSRNLRPVNLAELLSFGAAYPEMQLKFSILALGQIWQDPNRGRNIAALEGWGGGRDLVLRDSTSYFGEQSRLACVRM